MGIEPIQACSHSLANGFEDRADHQNGCVSAKKKTVGKKRNYAPQPNRVKPKNAHIKLNRFRAAVCNDSGESRYNVIYAW